MVIIFVMTNLTAFLSFPKPVRLLLINHFAGSSGFYMLIPFLADYLLTDIGLSAAAVGVILSVRNLSQQGLFLIGGSLSDRLGARGVIVTGLAVRAIGFALFAIGDSLAIVVAASALTGFAGALFNPAVRSYLAHASGERSAEAFALFSVAANLGSALGPIAGSLLVIVGFQVSAVIAASIFLTLAVLQLALLPPRPVERDGTRLRTDFARVIRDRRFHAFSLAVAAWLALEMQLYFLLTLQVQQLAGAEAAAFAVAAMFVTTTVAFFFLQVRITRVAGRRPNRGNAIASGLALSGAAFLIPPLAAPLCADSQWTVVRILPVLVAAVVLALGTMVAQPFINEAIPRFAGPRLTGTYYGSFYLFAGLATVVMTAATGALVDRTDALSFVPCLLCATAGAVAAVAVLALQRRGALPTTTAAETVGTRS